MQCLDMSEFSSDRGKHMIAWSCAQNEGVYGADRRVDGRGQMSMNLSPHTSISECVLCMQPHPRSAAWRRSIPAVSVGGSLLIVRTVCSRNLTHSSAHTLSAFDGEREAPSTEKESTERSTFRQTSQLYFSRSED